MLLTDPDLPSVQGIGDAEVRMDPCFRCILSCFCCCACYCLFYVAVFVVMLCLLL